MCKKLEIKSGDVYGRLTVIEEVDPHISTSGRKARKFLVQCECGSEPFEVALSSLRSGNTKSCGCVHKEKIKETHKKYNTYDLSGEYGIGWTSKGEEFYFDLEDYELIKDYMWYISIDGYVVTKDIDTRKFIQMHRLVMNAKDGMEVDHRFHKKNDNRKSQLREVTRSQNAMNRRIVSNNTSGVTGVHWDKQEQKWRARIMVNGKRINLGYFDDLEDAIQSRKDAEELYFGEYACKNIV